MEKVAGPFRPGDELRPRGNKFARYRQLPYTNNADACSRGEKGVFFLADVLGGCSRDSLRISRETGAPRRWRTTAKKLIETYLRL